MENIKKHKEIFIVILVTLGAIFYWFQIRPVSIKKNCSWVTETIEADPGVTKEQAEVNKKAFDICVAGGLCEGSRVEKWRNSTERPPSQERTETNEATEKEYNMCLRQHGL
jgi:hypothetical protein